MKKKARITQHKEATKTVAKQQPQQAQSMDQPTFDRNVMDATLRVLFENADKNALDLRTDIFDKANLHLSDSEMERLWDVLISSGWVSPTIGFGHAGKLELTKAGFQMMSQYGSYTNYITAMHGTTTDPKA
ncbi:MAG: hypothetical protein JSS78_07870 [Bacteroidetes bacterium]|nr:hypothetical protein [Bacteroidota bacterium]